MNDAEPGEEYAPEFEHINQLADETREFLFQDIDVEKGAVRNTHSFMEKVEALDNIFVHLQMSDLPSYEGLHMFMTNLHEEFDNLLSLLEYEERHHMHILEEESSNIEDLRSDLEHRKWMVAWKKAEKHTKKEYKELRVDINILRKVHDQLRILQQLIRKDEYVIIKDEVIHALKHDTEEVVELEYLVDYFDAFKKFIDFYERFFRSMIKKEDFLLELNVRNRKEL